MAEQHFTLSEEKGKENQLDILTDPAILYKIGQGIEGTSRN